MNHLISVNDLGLDGIGTIMQLAESFSEVSARPIPKVPALRGKTVATLFYEDSTRTRLSFEAAAKRLSADTMSFSVSTSSAKKGESLRDTVQTLDAMGVDALILRHSSAGAALQVTRWTSASVVNAGDGWHEHPTQALLDCYTIRQWVEGRGKSGMECFMKGLRVAIIGDVKHSRVARSNVKAFSLLGAEVVLVGPPTLMPPSLEGWPVEVADDLDGVLAKVDIVYLLRLQSERTGEALIPSLREYTQRWGMTRRRASSLGDGTIVMHPGPMNRGIEIASEVADLPVVAVTAQVRNGVAVRMAVLFALIGGPGGMSKETASGETGPGGRAEPVGDEDEMAQAQ